MTTAAKLTAAAFPPRLRLSSSQGAIGMLLLSCLSLQSGAALASRLFAVAGTTGTTLLRLGVAAVILNAIVRPDVRAWDRAQWRSVLLLGASLAAMNGMFYASLARIPLGTAVTIEFLGPLALAALTSSRRREAAWVLLALAGVGAMGLAHGGFGPALDGVGVLFAAGAGVFWALYILTSKQVGEAVPGQGGLAVAVAAAALLLLPLGAAGAVSALAHPASVPLAIGTAVLASVVPYTLEMNALRRLPTRTFGVLLSLEPAVATVAGSLLMSQHIGPLGVLGMLAVVGASAGSTLSSSEVAAADGQPRNVMAAGASPS